MKKNDILTSYSFLASLNENGTDIYEAVYIPLCKRALALYAKEQTQGTDQNIKKIIQDEYGIDMPILVIQKLIVVIADRLSRKQKEKFDFQYFEKGKSFQYKSYVFTDLEQSYQSERRQANALQQAFEEYVKVQDENTNANRNTNIPVFADFINRYKRELSSFLVGKTEKFSITEMNESYMFHVRFLQYIESNNDVLFKVVERIFVGSIIASYIESNINVHAKLENSITYYLDTKIVLEALDLQSEEDTQPIKELLQLICDTGGKVRILDVTLSEIHGIIDTAIQNYDKNCPTTTINEACVRIGKNKTWLTKINGNLEHFLLDTLKIEVTKVSDADIRDFVNSEDTKQLREIWYRKNAAEHDVIAYLYVRKRRKENSDKMLIQKSNYWFVTANSRLCHFNLKRKVNGSPVETVLPQELTSLLFLQNPNKYKNRVSKIGINELIAQTLSDEYPSRDIINEFDSAVKDNVDISDDDYRILLSAISQQSTIQLQKLLEKSISEKDNFNTQVHHIIAKERDRQNRERKQKNDAINNYQQGEKERKELNNKNQILEDKLEKLSQEVEKLQAISIKDQNENKRLKEDNIKMRLKDWKSPRYIISSFLCFFCVVVFALYFIATDWEFNYCAKLVTTIESFDEIKKDIARTVLYFLHSALFALSVNAIISLYMMKDEKEKEHWFLNLLKHILNK